MRYRITPLFLCFYLSAFAQAGTISGQVSDHSEPLPGAELKFYQIDDLTNPLDLKYVKSVLTDKQGWYEVALNGRYLVRVTFPGFYTASAWDVWSSVDEKKVLDFTLEVWGGDYISGLAPSLDIAGTVASLSGKPIPDATVIARKVEDFSEVLEARSDNTGKFILKPIRWGRYIIYAQKNGFNLSTSAMVETPKAQQVEILLSSPK